MTKVKHIGSNEHIREVIAKLPTYWDSLNDAVQTIGYLLTLGGYRFVAEEIMFTAFCADGHELILIDGVENGVSVSWHYMSLASKYEVTAYISL